MICAEEDVKFMNDLKSKLRENQMNLKILTIAFNWINIFFSLIADNR